MLLSVGKIQPLATSVVSAGVVSGFSRTSLEPVNLGDIGMVERGEDLGFALEPGKVGVRGQRVRQYLDRDRAFQVHVGCPVHFTHTAGTDKGGDLVRADACAGGQRHLARIL